jgi:hypothetical protein
MLTTAEIYAPIEDCDRLRELSQSDQQVMLAALLEIVPPRPHGMEITGLSILVDPTNPTAMGITDDELIHEVEAQRNLMISVATGGERIHAANPEYQQRRERMGLALAHRSLGDPNPYDDLWAWYGKWSSGDLPTYASRRQYLNELYRPLLDLLRQGPKAGGPRVFDEPTSWPKVDRSPGRDPKTLGGGTRGRAVPGGRPPLSRDANFASANGIRCGAASSSRCRCAERHRR